ncbi:MFS transporter [Rugamonas sp.]|uniref:MFS transporter n=1 Tax=Rugamonas sp. TaxID=1926287 RepID=UPI00345C40F5
MLLRLAAGLIGGYASSATLLVATQTPRERSGWALGILSAGALSGTLIGPLIGGVLPGLIGIRMTFFLGELRVERAHVVVDAGIVMAASAFGSILMAARLGRLADRIGGWKVIIYCLLAAGVLLVPQAFVTQWWQLAALRFLMGMALAGLLPSVAKVIRQSVPEKALGRMLGYAQSSQYAGQVLGPLLGGALGGLVGMRAVFFLTSVLLLAGAMWNWRALRSTRPDNS